MQEQFTSEELKNLNVLIGRATLKGDEALATALLQQKIQRMFEAAQKAEQPKPEPKAETPNKEGAESRQKTTPKA